MWAFRALFVFGVARLNHLNFLLFLCSVNLLPFSEFGERRAYSGGKIALLPVETDTCWILFLLFVWAFRLGQVSLVSAWQYLIWSMTWLIVFSLSLTRLFSCCPYSGVNYSKWKCHFVAKRSIYFVLFSVPSGLKVCLIELIVSKKVTFVRLSLRFLSLLSLYCPLNVS